MTKDPICGMTVDEAKALSAERDGVTSYFCSEHCRKKFLAQRHFYCTVAQNNHANNFL